MTLRIAVTASPEWLRFEVVDEGLGIPAADQTRIFDSFTQLHSETDRSHGGAGLGLAISAHLVAVMGGRLEVQSEPDCGSTFFFTIPCGESGDICLPSEANSHSLPTIASLRILAADDAPAGRRILEEVLTADGHRPQCVADGRGVIAAFEKEPYDLVLLDLRMPEVDGVTAAAAIRGYEREHGRARTPIVAVTADAMTPDGAAAWPDDFDGYVTKPFSADALRRTVASCARRTSGVDAIEPIAYAAPATTIETDSQSRANKILARLQGRRELLVELVDLFLSDAAQLHDEIEKAWEERNLHRLRTAVHRLRGQLEMLEVQKTAAVSLLIEQACEQGEVTSIDDHLTTLTRLWPGTCDQIAELRSP